MSSYTPQKLFVRTIWLAFQASSPVGYGFLQAEQAAKLTEESIEHNLKDQLAAGVVDTDYFVGRMMKTTFKIEDDTVAVYPETPRLDYQSWGSTYEKGSDIVAMAQLELEEEGK